MSSNLMRLIADQAPVIADTIGMPGAEITRDANGDLTLKAEDVAYIEVFAKMNTKFGRPNSTDSMPRSAHWTFPGHGVISLLGVPESHNPRSEVRVFIEAEA